MNISKVPNINLFKDTINNMIYFNHLILKHCIEKNINMNDENICDTIEFLEYTCKIIDNLGIYIQLYVELYNNYSIKKPIFFTLMFIITI